MTKWLSSPGFAVAAATLLIVAGSFSGAQAVEDVPTSNVVTFQLDLLAGAGEGPASNWYRIEGGGMRIHDTSPTIGTDRLRGAPPRNVEIENVEVVGPFVSGGSRAELLQILNQWSTQSGERFNSTLEMLGPDQQVVRTVDFFDCVPVEYHPPSVRAGDESLLEEMFVWKAERIEDVVADQPPPPPPPASESSNLPGTLAGTEIEDVLTGGCFRFEIDGREIPVTSVEPGAFGVRPKGEGVATAISGRIPDAAPATRLHASCGDWRITRSYNTNDLELKELFNAFATGARKTNPSDAGSLVYLDRDGNEARRINFFGFTPLHYESVNVDSRNAGEAASEVMEFAVLRCEYA